jgi:hypothetical protein
LTFGFVVGTSDAVLAGLEAVESVLCAVLVVESVVAGEAGADVDAGLIGPPPAWSSKSTATTIWKLKQRVPSSETPIPSVSSPF